MANAFTPVITSAVLTPNPAVAGKTVQISVSATDIEAIPSTPVYLSGEFRSGEV